MNHGDTESPAKAGSSPRCETEGQGARLTGRAGKGAEAQREIGEIRERQVLSCNVGSAGSHYTGLGVVSDYGHYKQY
jgi:hypothetical protein